MENVCQMNKVSLSSPDVLKSPPTKIQAAKVSFDTECKELYENVEKCQSNSI